MDESRVYEFFDDYIIFLKCRKQLCKCGKMKDPKREHRKGSLFATFTIIMRIYDSLCDLSSLSIRGEGFQEGTGRVQK